MKKVRFPSGEITTVLGEGASEMTIGAAIAGRTQSLVTGREKSRSRRE
jgi:hypothetical protein